MDNAKSTDAEAEGQDESVQEFKDDVENDPSTAKPADEESDDVGRLRGG